MINFIKSFWLSVLAVAVAITLLLLGGWFIALGIIASVISLFVIYNDFIWWGATTAAKKYGSGRRR